MKRFFTLVILSMAGLILYAQPANDDPCSATSLLVGSSCNSQVHTNAAATASAGVPAPGCASYSGGDVWFTVTVPASGQLIFETQSGVITDGGLAIYSGTCGSLTLIECDDDDGPGLMSMINRTGLTPGSTIWIRVWEYGNNNNGSFGICVYDPNAGGGGGGSGCMMSYAGHTLTSGPNGCDDCSSASINLGFNYGICGNSFSAAFVNSNGNVSFGSSYTTYTAVGMPNSSTRVMVAPFWADADLRSCGQIYHSTATANHFIVTWEGVGYYSSHCDKVNTYQLVLTDGFQSTIGVGNNTAFYFGDMNWTTGDASSGTNGFGGSPAVVGINANDGVNYSLIGNFDNATSAYDGPAGANDGVNYLDNQCYTFAGAGCSILPFNTFLIEATATAEDFILVEWKTNTIGNTYGFWVEKSADGVEFETLEFVPGTGQIGEHVSEYAYQDADVSQGGLYSYRVRYHDADGNEFYSPVVNVKMEALNDVRFGNVYPNPAVNKKEVLLPVKATEAPEISILLFDQVGKKIMEINEAVSVGSGEISIPTGSVAPGVYFVQVRVNGQIRQNQRLVIH